MPIKRTQNKRFGCGGKIAGWDKLKALVLDSVSDANHQKGVQHGAGRVPGLVPAGAAARLHEGRRERAAVSLEARWLGSSSIIIRMSAIRKLAAEAADNGLLAPELAGGIARVKSAKSVGIRTGNWLSVRQAQSLLQCARRQRREGPAGSRHPCRSSRVRSSAIGGRGAHFHASPATRWPLVRRRSTRDARPHSYSTDADMG
jgi:hypothetical protein